MYRRKPNWHRGREADAKDIVQRTETNRRRCALDASVVFWNHGAGKRADFPFGRGLEPRTVDVWFRQTMAIKSPTVRCHPRCGAPGCKAHTGVASGAAAQRAEEELAPEAVGGADDARASSRTDLRGPTGASAAGAGATGATTARGAATGPSQGCRTALVGMSERFGKQTLSISRDGRATPTSGVSVTSRALFTRSLKPDWRWPKPQLTNAEDHSLP